MSYFTRCTLCGASLDPGERCTCEQEKKERLEKLSKSIIFDPVTGQGMFGAVKALEENDK